jgi:hypothetical protein
LKHRVLLLIAGCAGLWFVVAGGVLAYRANRDQGLDLATEENKMLLLQTGVAALLCLVPTAVTLLWCDLVLGGSPEQQLAAVFGGTGLRMVFVVAVGMVLYFNFEAFNRTDFWLWVILFYLATLTLEMALVLRRQGALDKKRGEAA